MRLFRRSRHYPVDLLRFLRWAWSSRPDVIVFQAPLKFPLVDGLVVRLMRRWGIRVATTVHDVLPHYPSAWSHFTYKFFYRSFDRLVAHGKAAEAQLSTMGINLPVLVVPHGVYDIYRITGVGREAARQRVGGLTNSEFVLLFFGRIDERKGIEALLQYGNSLGESDQIKIVVAGIKGISQPKTRKHDIFEAAKRSGTYVILDKRISFEDVETLFSACDTVVLPYIEGTTSGVLKLAMAFGKPVVATDIGDIPETVPSDVGVVVSHAAVAAALPEAVSRLRATYEAYQANWASHARRFAWDGIGKRYFDFLADELNKDT